MSTREGAGLYGLPTLRPTVVLDRPIDEFQGRIVNRISDPVTQDSVRTMMSRGWETYVPFYRRFFHDGV
jgi:hypothetical protein